MKHLILFMALLPAPAMAAELWCMPETICSDETTCVSTTDEELSVRLADRDAPETTLRAHAEDVPMMRHPGTGSVEWMGTNAAGLAEALIWAQADNAFTYAVTLADGAIRKATGYCEVQ